MKENYSIIYAPNFPINGNCVCVVVSNYKNSNQVCISGINITQMNTFNDDDIAIFKEKATIITPIEH